ncbi:MAG: hypothetical protein KDA41_01295 [Planctomycetales bacterium]|nr:hypothetical protein [Planctomycetales bacterium]
MRRSNCSKNSLGLPSPLRARMVAAFLAALVVAQSACSRSERPRTKDDIFQDRLTVDTLYITADGQQITAPGNADRALVVDQAAGAIAWPAWRCDNPACPGRSATGEPFVFPWPDPFASVSSAGAIVIRQPVSDADFKTMDDYAEQKCPQCLAQRNIARESDETRQQYKNWCQPHVLPSAAKRLAELDAESAAIAARQRERFEQRQDK